ncbi:hypothetical protein RBSWK_05352 [Rhodopirellula baltica SWK14]|uniref:Uncharacterized protein n=1 Tax=Rhodopirellula baltica SWK14 TaxID=993516 RepID=L7CC98_RHOBT|nr:hypothetical protein RBSWK_05352 [Rhodopirellula baltica SWK14]
MNQTINCFDRTAFGEALKDVATKPASGTVQQTTAGIEVSFDWSQR